MTHKLIRALRNQNEGPPPVWLMRQAGRYMPEYRVLRKKYTLLELFHNEDLITEVTLLPIKLLDVDAAILFSDILMVTEALGVGLSFEEGVGPIIHRPVTSEKDIENLSCSENAFTTIYLAIANLKTILEVPLIGFAGGPFTVASYMVEGGSSKTLKTVRQWMYRSPETFHNLLEKITEVTIQHLKGQVQAGVDVLQIFDTWAGQLTSYQVNVFVKPYLEKIVKAMQPVPTILFSLGTSVVAETFVSVCPTAMSLDAQTDLSAFRRCYALPLQGNLDPYALYASPEYIRNEVFRILHQMEGDPGFIFNLGHGVLPDTPVDAVKVLVETVKTCVLSF